MPEPASILFCIDSLDAGGSQRQTVELITRLDRERFGPRVVYLHGARAGFSCRFVAPLEAAGVEVEGLDLRWSPIRLPANLLRFSATVRRHRPALVHTINLRCNHLARLGRWLRLMPRGTPLIVAIRTDYNARQLFYERVEHRAADCLVSNNPQMLTKLRTQAHVPPEKLVYIPNGLDLARFTRNPDPGLRARHGATGARVGVMVGRITLQKSPYLLAEAVGRLKARGQLADDVRFWIIGDRDSVEQQEKLDDAIRHHGLSNQVVQFPPTDRPEAYYHAADFTVLASLWEGVPNAVLESFAAGRPAVVSEAANACRLVEPGATGWLVRTKDIADLAARLEEVLLLPPERLAAMAEACRRTAAQFSLVRMVERYQELYATLAFPRQTNG